MSNVIQIKNLNIFGRFDVDEKKIVEDLNFSVGEKESLAIVGESGCGKTMTAMSIFGLLPNNCRASGEILFENKNIIKMSEKTMSKIRGDKFVMIPSGAEFLNPVLKVKTQIFETLEKIGIKDKVEKQKIALQKLQDVGFDDPTRIMNLYSFMLSGGMAQKVVIALASCTSPKLVVADELTKGIDGKTANSLLDKLGQTFNNSALIIITHDISLAAKCDNTLVMWGGKVLEYGNTKEVFENPLHHYTKSLIASLPKNNFQMGGSVTPSSNECCPFAKYCLDADAECFTCQQILRNVKGRKVRCKNA